MNKSTSTNPQRSSDSSAPSDTGFSPWQRLKTKRISYLTLPLLIMATVTEFVILATGWSYQRAVCLPQGMGVTFFGIGPIGATILAVELLKLPLAIWTASRSGWQKTFMLWMGLPLICVLTFQLVKDMAVYEMGVAMAPSSQMLEKAMVEETKIKQLKGELAAIEGKKVDREGKLAEFNAKRAKAKADLEESLKRNEETRQDAISLTEYQKKELSEVESRQATIIQQFNSDTEQLNKAIADLRTRREVEVGRSTKWNAEDARIENEYKTKLAEYTNKKNTYEKDKAEYENANFLKRQFMREPVDPGVPPVRESNTILKPTAVAEIDAQIATKEAELLAVNNKRRDRVAQVDADARRLREEFDRRSTSKREETDKRREELATAQAKLETDLKAEEKDIDTELAAAVKKVDGIRAEIDTCQKKAETYYEAREASIRTTQVHRIATTVEILRGLIKGERPMSIKTTAKERGDILTDQISMVRIWVYPVLAFIVAFLPTLMVEIGFSTVFHADQAQALRPPHRLGFFGRRLHWLYIRAGRQKILRAERLARESEGEIAIREERIAAERAAKERALAAKDAEVQAAREAITAAEAEREEQLKKKEEDWVAKLAGMADSLNRAIIEKDELRDLQRSEVDRQVQMRQNAWSDRLTQLRQELDQQLAASQAEREALIQENHKKLMEMSEDCKDKIAQARRQVAEAELSNMDSSAKQVRDLKEALEAKEAAESRLKHQTDTFSRQLSETKEDAARELEKSVRHERHRFEEQQSAFEKLLAQQERELKLKFDARLAEENAKVEQESRRREAELERQLETRSREAGSRWSKEVQQLEESAHSRLKQQEQQLQAQAELRLSDALKQAEEDLRRREMELERQLETRSREAEARLNQELQQKEELFLSKSRQRDQEWQARLDAIRVEVQTQAEQEVRRREGESAEARSRAIRELEVRLRNEIQEKDAVARTEARQREQDLLAQLAAQQEALAQAEKERDEARESTTQFYHQVEDMRNRLTEATSLLTGSKNGNGNGKRFATAGKS